MNRTDECIFFLIVFFMAGCGESKIPDPAIEKGRQLATQYCGSCHQLPDPGLLNKTTWFASVLPKMGGFMGLRYFEGATYASEGKPGTIAIEDWNNILAYYVRSAPDSLQDDEDHAPSPASVLPGFMATPFKDGIQVPATTFVGIFPKNNNRILFANGFTEQIYSANAGGRPVDSMHAGKGVTHIAVDSQGMHVLAMGVMHPSDGRSGQMLMRRTESDTLELVLDSLQRPVFAQYQDINSDGRMDMLLCEFGNYQGRLSWYEQDKNRRFVRHVLRESPGAVHTSIADLNGDGLADIIALMAQGDEGIFIYYQQKDGSFRETRALRFPPSYGSNYFELIDFNGDGHPDILATNGDNGDYAPILKPYHGIRVYLNDGQNHFTEKIFLPMYGATKAMARDFDGDGDLDIASIAYFADYDGHPESGFLYWENKGHEQFSAYTCPEALLGHWLTMDVGDLNEDGKTDIMLGSANLPLGKVKPEIRKKWAADPVAGLMLMNRNK